MAERLHYETRAGHVSEADTFTQLLEFLRLAEECAYTLGHLADLNSDHAKGTGWRAIGEMFKMTQINVTNLATKSIRIKAGLN